MKLEVVALTHAGLVREHNEDTIAIGAWLMQTPMPQPQQFLLDLQTPAVLLVADGLGGHHAGDVASRFVAERCSALFTGSPLTTDGIEATLQQTNRELYDRTQEQPEWAAMGSTIVGLAVTRERTLVFNVGDSRAYRLQDGFLEQLSIDDAFAPLDYGEPPAEAKTGIITQALGGAPVFTPIDPHLRGLRTRPGGVYLLCSDGLSDALSLDEMEDAFDEDLTATATRLFEGAMRAGGDDNISLIIARIEEVDR